MPNLRTFAPASLAPATTLRLVKIVHTLVWAVLASCVVAIPIAAWRGELAWAFALVAIVFVEVGVLLANRWRCPLTDVAARYTEERADNFDIYLPLWLARYNKVVFGTLYVAGLLFTIARWSAGQGR